MRIKSLVNVIWVLTFIGFFALLILSYAVLPERVGILADSNGFANEFVTKEMFFYVALALFTAFNALGFICLRVLASIPVGSPLYARNEPFKERFTAWSGSLVAAVNVCMICAVAYLTLFNTRGSGSISSFNYLIYIGPACLLISLGWLFSVLNRRRQLA